MVTKAYQSPEELYHDGDFEKTIKRNYCRKKAHYWWKSHVEMGTFDEYWIIGKRPEAVLAICNNNGYLHFRSYHPQTPHCPNLETLAHLMEIFVVTINKLYNFELNMEAVVKREFHKIVSDIDLLRNWCFNVNFMVRYLYEMGCDCKTSNAKKAKEMSSWENLKVQRTMMFQKDHHARKHCHFHYHAKYQWIAKEKKLKRKYDKAMTDSEDIEWKAYLLSKRPRLGMGGSGRKCYVPAKPKDPCITYTLPCGSLEVDFYDEDEYRDLE